MVFVSPVSGQVVGEHRLVADRMTGKSLPVLRVVFIIVHVDGRSEAHVLDIVERQSVAREQSTAIRLKTCRYIGVLRERHRTGHWERIEVVIAVSREVGTVEHGSDKLCAGLLVGVQWLGPDNGSVA